MNWKITNEEEMSKNEFASLQEKQLYLDTIAFIQKAHEGQYRKYTYVPYWTHPIRVANFVLKFKESHAIDDLVVAALLHDILEDTKVGASELTAQGFSSKALELVNELTSNKEIQNKVGKAEYLSQKMLEMSSWALVIKLCDRLDNVTDFVYAPQSFIDKYKTETITILDNLYKGRELSQTHRKIMSAIIQMMSLDFSESNKYDALDLLNNGWGDL